MSKPTESVLAVLPQDTAPGADLDSGAWMSRELPRVEEANLAFYEAFTLKDIGRMAEVWAHSPHARCVHPGWELVIGWTDIRQSWLEIFSTVETIDFHIGDVHVEVSGRAAWVNLVASVQVTTETGDTFQAAVVTTNMFELSENQWRMVLHHSSNFVEHDPEEEEEEGDMSHPQGSNPDFEKPN